jgi:hypothetical protein
MQYCLPIEKAAPLAARVFASSFSDGKDAQVFAKAMVVKG